MCQSLKVFNLLLIITYTNGQFSKEQQYQFYAPSTRNFNDIYTSGIAMLAEEPSLTTSSTEDKEFHILIPSQLVEFRLPTTTEPPTRPTPPPPKYIFNSSDRDEQPTETTQKTTSTTTTVKTTELPPPIPSILTVIPIKTNPERGLLDLLFPTNRVKTFKNVFDIFRRILSHTFK